MQLFQAISIAHHAYTCSHAHTHTHTKNATKLTILCSQNRGPF